MTTILMLTFGWNPMSRFSVEFLMYHDLCVVCGMRSVERSNPLHKICYDYKKLRQRTKRLLSKIQNLTPAGKGIILIYLYASRKKEMNPTVLGISKISLNTRHQ